MGEVSWKQMLIPVMIFTAAITVQMLALIPLFVSIPGYESIPHLDLISQLIDLISWLLIILCAMTAYGCVEEAGIDAMTRIKIDAVLTIIGVGFLILGSSINIQIVSIIGLIYLLLSIGDIMYFAILLPGPITGRRL